MNWRMCQRINGCVIIVKVEVQYLADAADILLCEKLDLPAFSSHR